MASIRKNELKSGTSYRIVVKVKSQRTGKVETKSMTWKVPKGLNEEQIQKQLKQVADEFEFNEKCKETSFNICVRKTLKDIFKKVDVVYLV